MTVITVWDGLNTKEEQTKRWEGDLSLKSENLMDLCILLYTKTFECTMTHATKMIYSDVSDTFEFHDVSYVHDYINNMKKFNGI